MNFTRDKRRNSLVHVVQTKTKAAMRVRQIALCYVNDVNEGYMYRSKCKKERALPSENNGMDATG